MSGQSINFEKSMVYFSPNTLMPHRMNFGGLLKMKVVTKLDGYLGLPIPIRKKKSSVFKSILDCTTASRINCWLKRLLPNDVLSKWYGGLGFKDLRLFNVALLGQQVWHLINCKDTLCYSFLSAKYFPNGDVFNPKSMDKPSYTCQSIAKAASALCEGFSWNGIDEEAKVIWERAVSLSHDFQIFNLLEKPMLPRMVMEKVWRKPSQGVVKINFNAIVAGKTTSYGLLARDSDGFVLGGSVGVLEKDLQIYWGELQALEESIKSTCSNNWTKLEFESDCVSLVNRFNKRNYDLT
ncbi:hypothetical protein Gorai_021561, partial [Gossypium raimondii]|nr:hypothetical protein [Gossypium raimondii]